MTEFMQSSLFVTKPTRDARDKWKARWIQVARGVAEATPTEKEKTSERGSRKVRDVPWHHVLAPAMQLPSRHVSTAPKPLPERHVFSAESWWQAVQHGDYTTVEHALSSLRWNHFTTAFQRTALHIAAMHSQAACLTSLLAHDALVNSCDKLKRTSLHYACEVGSLSCVKVLLSHGANVDVRDKAYDTPLHCAARNHKTAIVKYLCDTQRHALRVNAKNKRRETPLLLAVKNAAPRDIVVTLLANGATPTVTDVDDYDSITYAARDRPVLLETLLSSNQPHTDVKPRRSALAEALLHNSASCVQLLLMHRQHMALEVTSTGMTAVAVAAACCSTDALVELVRHNGEKSLLTEDINGVSPLVHAALASSMNFDTLFTILDLNPEACLYRNRRYDENVIECLLRVARVRNSVSWMFAVPWLLRHGAAMTTSALRLISPLRHCFLVSAPKLQVFGSGDVKIVCSNGDVWCYRWLLVLHSAYFASLFNFQPTSTVTMDGVDVEQFRICMSWMGGNYDVLRACSHDKLFDVLYLCNEYLFERMQFACEIELFKRYRKQELSYDILLSLTEALQLKFLSYVLSHLSSPIHFLSDPVDAVLCRLASTSDEARMNHAYDTLMRLQFTFSLAGEYLWLLQLLLNMREGAHFDEQEALLKNLLQIECINNSVTCESFLRSCFATTANRSAQHPRLQLLLVTHFCSLHSVYVAVKQHPEIYVLCPQNILGLLERGYLLHSGDQFDIQFQCENEVFRLHQGVIMQSEKLAGLLRFHGNSTEPIMLDVDCSTFRDIVCYLYCGFVMHHEDSNAIEQLLTTVYAADEYLIPGMVAYMESLLSKCVDENTCASIYHTARCLNLNALACMAGKAFLKCYYDLVGSDLQRMLSNTDFDIVTWSGPPPRISAAIAEYDVNKYCDSFCVDVLMHLMSYSRCNDVRS